MHAEGYIIPGTNFKYILKSERFEDYTYFSFSNKIPEKYSFIFYWSFTEYVFYSFKFHFKSHKWFMIAFPCSFQISLLKFIF